MEKSKVIKVQPLQLVVTDICIVGDRPLLMEKLNTTVTDAIDDKRAHKVVKKDTRTEEERVEEKIHYTQDGNIGFPSAGFAKGMVEVAPYFDGITKKVVRSIQMEEEIIPIKFKKQTINFSNGKNSGFTRSPRKIVRPEFRDWKCTLRVTFNQALISAEQVVSLLNWAGFHQGIGGWRPECGGTYGRYHVQTNGKGK